MKYLSIDIETTGLDPESCQILEVAAILDDLKNPLPLERLPIFQQYLRYPVIIGQPFALSMHSEILKRLASKDQEEACGTECDPEVLVFRFRRWLEAQGIDLKQSLTPAGKNFGSFDLQFLKRLPEWGCSQYGVRLKHRSLDPSILYFDPEIDDQLPDSLTCMQRAGIEGPVAHTAVEDALVVVRLIRHKLLREEM